MAKPPTSRRIKYCQLTHGVCSCLLKHRLCSILRPKRQLCKTTSTKSGCGTPQTLIWKSMFSSRSSMLRKIERKTSLEHAKAAPTDEHPPSCRRTNPITMDPHQMINHLVLPREPSPSLHLAPVASINRAPVACVVRVMHGGVVSA